MKRRYVAWGLLAIVLGAGALQIPIGGSGDGAESVTSVQGIDLSSHSDAAPSEPLDLLFIHHSVGGHLLAERGAGGDKLDSPHPNGGGLRKLLAQNNYRVNEVTYGSKLGEHTDLFDWLPKFRDNMDAILRASVQDAQLPEGRRNRVVLWKSCYPNNEFEGQGSAPGNPSGPALTLANAQATMREVRKELAKRKDVLFVYLTAPPLAPKAWPEPAWKWTVKKLLGKPTSLEKLSSSAHLAREFNNWMKSPDGWLKGYAQSNIVVFDYFDVLTDEGRANLSRYPTGDGSDSHPSSEGNAKAAARLVPFLNRAARRAGLLGPSVVGQVEPAAAPVGASGSTAVRATDG